MADGGQKQSTQPASDKKDSGRNNRQGPNKRFHSDKHSHKKRVPLKPYQRKNDIYVTGKSDFKAQVKQCEEILNGEEGEVFLHAIGNAINRSINLALSVVANSNGAVAYEANTSTIELVDDFHPLNDEDDYTIQQRMNSCLHIRIFRQSKNLKT
ncbi:unnamed protein product [Hermetia illucens]|uniref:Ribonuclease P protein subunit p20 n=1 Tax=Hermetia illucens TaxID=343691 RepID=A0A7R8UCK6_HERIL|nr:ribonuclease P protein subunit p20 [Hermetia illucens]CAD7078287.1 unnamed protein product [Hermetia illucens]